MRLEGQPVSRIVEGAVCLNDPIAARACLAIFEVSRSAHPSLSDGTGETGWPKSAQDRAPLPPLVP